MILFIFGEDTYRSKQKLDSIKQKYIDASFGDTNLSIIDFADKKTDFTEINRMIMAQPFLAKKRLVVIKNLFKKSWKKLQEEVAIFLPKIPTSSVVLFYEKGIPDRRSKLFKTLNKPRVSQEFKPLNPAQLRSWIRKRLDKNLEINKIGLNVSQLVDLISKSGGDLWQISANIEKVSLYTGTNCENANREELEKLVTNQTEVGIFSLIDALGQKNAKLAISTLHNLLEEDKNVLYIFTMIVYGFRNLLVIKDLAIRQTENMPQYKLFANISKEAKINPYVVRKTLQSCSNFSLSELKKIYQLLFGTDIKIKTGRIDPVLALDLLVTKICS